MEMFPVHPTSPTFTPTLIRRLPWLISQSSSSDASGFVMKEEQIHVPYPSSGDIASTSSTFPLCFALGFLFPLWVPLMYHLRSEPPDCCATGQHCAGPSKRYARDPMTTEAATAGVIALRLQIARGPRILWLLLVYLGVWKALWSFPGCDMRPLWFGGT
ncbi:hypothetical protein D5086_019214 [Populus alba]|uniref:Uncharacterized protein n=1 Tax=Populus alba TaxID=43335 RepID=A0ACC4BGP6_POPAL